VLCRMPARGMLLYSNEMIAYVQSSSIVGAWSAAVSAILTKSGPGTREKDGVTEPWRFQHHDGLQVCLYRGNPVAGPQGEQAGSSFYGPASRPGSSH
jgi:hypothetical protein